MEKQFLTPEELLELNQLNTKRNELVNSLGVLEFEIQSLDLQKDKLKEKLGSLLKESETLGEKLQEKYGEGNVNVETGEFIKR